MVRVGSPSAWGVFTHAALMVKVAAKYNYPRPLHLSSL